MFAKGIAPKGWLETSRAGDGWRLVGTGKDMHHFEWRVSFFFLLSFWQISLGLLPLWKWAGSPGCFKCSLKAGSSPCTLISGHCVQEAPV